MDGEPYVVAKDVADVLDYRETDKFARLIDDRYKGTQIVGTLGGPQEMTVISEPRV